jgi:hypothetical protein
VEERDSETIDRRAQNRRPVLSRQHRQALNPYADTFGAKLEAKVRRIGYIRITEHEREPPDWGRPSCRHRLGCRAGKSKLESLG